MNPFETEKSFDHNLYEIITKLNKNSDKHVLKGLEDLLRSINDDISLSNIMLKDVIKKHLTSKNLEIRRKSVEILFNFLENGEPTNDITDILCIWLYDFILDLSDEIGRKMFDKYIVIEDLMEEFLNYLDFSKDEVGSLKCCAFVLKNCSLTRVNKSVLDKYKTKVSENCIHFKLNSNLLLSKIYLIMKLLRPIDGIYVKITNIYAAPLMNSKWKILLDIYQKVPKCVEKDSKYLNKDILQKIIKKTEFTDRFEVKNPENLYIVFVKVQDKKEYLMNYVERYGIKNICPYMLDLDFVWFDNVFGAEKTNLVVESLLKTHTVEKSDISKVCIDKCLQNIPRDDILFELLDVDSINAQNPVRSQRIEKDIEKLSLNITEKHCCSSIDHRELCRMYRDALFSLKYLNQEMVILRSSILGVYLNDKFFRDDIIEKMLPDAVNVFKKDSLLKFKESGNNIGLIKKYPDLYEEEYIDNIINDENYSEFINIFKFKNVLIKFMDNKDNDWICAALESYEWPPVFDLFFSFKVNTSLLRQIDYNEIFTFYLDYEFLDGVVQSKIFNRREFLDHAIIFLANYNIPNTTEYSGSFFDKLPYFYENIQLRHPLHEIHILYRIFNKIAVSNIEKTFLRVLCEILVIKHDTDNKFECSDFDLGNNSIFLKKVKYDCGFVIDDLNFVDPEVLIKNRSFKSIDYVVRNKKPTARFLLNIDFTYLSNKALQSAVAVLLDEISRDKDADKEEFYSFSNESFDSMEDAEYLYLIDKVTIKERASIFDIIDLIENDKIIYMPEFSKERFEIYKPLFEYLYNDASNTMANNFTLSKVETNMKDNELFEFVVSCLPKKPVLFWKFLINSLFRSRNIEMCIVLERMIILQESTKSQLKVIENEDFKLIAYTLPNLYSKFFNTKVDLSDYIKNESKRSIAYIETKIVRQSDSMIIKVSYVTDSDDFAAEIKIPHNYPFDKPVFSTNIERKSLLNKKISEYLRCTSKYMAVMNFWKINIDKKIEGINECLICYFIIESLTGKFPSFVCHTCGNRFHDRCILKWIRDSKKDTCPVCRTYIRDFILGK